MRLCCLGTEPARKAVAEKFSSPLEKYTANVSRTVILLLTLWSMLSWQIYAKLVVEINFDFLSTGYL